MHNPEQSIRLRSSARTSTGQVRENNEDNIHLWARDNFVLAVVADGMGGAAAGEEASRIAVDTIQNGLVAPEYRGQEQFDDLTDEIITKRLRGAVSAANDLIMQRAASFPDLKGMGTTVTLAFVRKTHAIVAHVGDSRAYLIHGRDNSITQITSDHSFVEALLAAGHITPEQAEDHPMRNVLYRALGQGEEIDVDVYDAQLRIGDRLVLCSDGLTRHVKPHEIAEIALEEDNPEVSSQRLIDLTNERGGEDNVSVIVILVEEIPPLTPRKLEAPVISGENEETLRFRERPLLTFSDQDDTPHLRDKSYITNTSSNKVTTDASKVAVDLKETLEVVANTSKGEEDTERVLIDDTTEENQETQVNQLDRAIATRPDVMHTSLVEPTSVKNRRAYDEGDGEGQDTSKPDQ